ncbi:sugar transferase [Ramlibacter henchirensis]|uniref:sugar transferase n=1 Tax=Ramlibacter henchirensis TaxID=204072 RepID=UPI003B847EFF
MPLPELQRLAAVSKRAFDLVFAGGLLLVLLPLFAFVAFGVWRSSRGPILYNQQRVGMRGKMFRFYKFRSMVTNSDEFLTSFLESNPGAKSRWEEFQKLDDDPRITPFGRFIRRSSLDELPQLWNVLKGDMSLVGPRPCMADQRALYGRHWVSYCAVRPGMTGLWQVSGRNRLTYQQRVALDTDYVERWSPFLDVKILLRTFIVVLTGDGSQ